MVKFYLQVQKDGTITDCISFPHGDYIEFKGTVPLDILGGWYKLENGVIVEYPELKPKDTNAEIEELRLLVADLTEIVLMGGIN